MRTMTLLLCLRLAGIGLAAAGLAGCAGASADLTASVGEPATPATASSSAPARTAANSQAGKPKRGDAKKDDTKDDDWWKEGGVTREKVSAMCWMKYEKGRKDLPIDKRADLVNACVEQTLAQHPLR